MRSRYRSAKVAQLRARLTPMDLLVFLLAGLLVLAMFGLSRASEWDETLAKAKEEGKFVAVLGGGASRNYRPIFKYFEDKFGIRTVVSTGGGQEPVWAHSGRELFYKASGNLMAVEVLPGATFVTGERRVLFSTQGFRSSAVHQSYDVTPDGQRFVMIRNPDADELGELIVVENFFEQLKAKVGN